MARVNLLPWREELRKQKRTEFFSVLGVCAAIALGVWLAVHLHYVELIKQQEARNAFLAKQIKLLDKKIKEIKELEKEKENLIARMKAIETLQTSRPIIVHLFDELVSTLPEGVHLQQVSQNKKKVTVKGVAQSNARVSNYMRNIESSEWVDKPKLSIIETKTKNRQRFADFTMTMVQTIPESERPSEDEEEF